MGEYTPDYFDEDNRWYSFWNTEGTLLYLIEAISQDTARCLLFNEFGIRYADLHSCSFDSYNDMLAHWELIESDLRRPHPRWNIHTRTHDRKVYRSERDGLACERCGHFYVFALANLAAGKLECYGCRHGW